MRRAIECPAERAGLGVEPALTDALIADVLDEPGGLPLLSAALLEQWRERDGRVMRHAAYERTGGVRGAVGRLAERTYAQLGEPEQRAARRILLRLAGDGDVRRRVPLEEFDEQTLAALTDSRLVTVDEGTVEVAHEALLREWPRLRAWLDDDAPSLAPRRVSGAASGRYARGTMTSAATGIYAKYERAEKHFKEFQQGVADYSAGKPFQVYTERPAKDRKLWRVRVKEPIPVHGAVLYKVLCAGCVTSADLSEPLRP